MRDLVAYLSPTILVVGASWLGTPADQGAVPQEVMENVAQSAVLLAQGVRYGLNRNRTYTSVVCYPAVQVVSNGFWVGDNPFLYTLPTILLQGSLVVILSRLIQVLLKPLKQPYIVSNILAGIILGPIARKELKSFHATVFPKYTAFVTSTASTLGVIYYMFLVGVRLDLSLILMGKKLLTIGVVGIVMSVSAGAIVVAALGSHTTNIMADGPFYAALISCLATSAFPVVQHLLADFHILNSDLGSNALSVALVNHVFGWITLILLESIKDGQFRMNSLLTHLATTTAFVAFAFVALRPIMHWIVRRTPEGKSVESRYVVSILVGVLVMSLVTEFSGLSMLEGSMILGIVVPDGPPLGSTLAEKTETLVTSFMLPFFFLNSTVFMDLWGISDWTAVGILCLASFVAMAGKFLSTLVVAMFFNMTFHDAFSLSVVLCAKGMIDIIAYSQWAMLRMMDKQAFTTLMVSAVTMTAIVGPIVRSMTSSSRSLMPYTWYTIQHCKPNAELRILTCIHSQDHVPSILSLLGSVSVSKDNPICVYAMHVVDLVGRATPLLIAHKPNKKSTLTSSSSSKSIFSAFRSFERHFHGHLVVQPFTSVAPSVSIHKDVCSIALQRKVSLILVPFHKQESLGGGLNSVDPVLQVMNPNIVRESPCSVGIVVDRSSFRGRFVCAVMVNSGPYNVGLFFLGGPDDREALAYAAHMGDQPRVSLTVWRLMSRDSVGENSRERRADDEMVASFRGRHAGNARVQYKELLLADCEELLNVLRTVEDVYDLVMVGRHPAMNLVLVEGLSLWSENPELGPLGDLCSSSDFFGGTASVLVMQQQINRQRSSIRHAGQTGHPRELRRRLRVAN
ncbi:hypothetical protein ACLOJK_031426 [Asimina triloba]